MKHLQFKVGYETLTEVLIPTYIKSIKELMDELPPDWERTFYSDDDLDENELGQLKGIYEGIQSVHNQHWNVRSSMEFI